MMQLLGHFVDGKVENKKILAGSFRFFFSCSRKTMVRLQINELIVGNIMVRETTNSMYVYLPVLDGLGGNVIFHIIMGEYAFNMARDLRPVISNILFIYHYTKY